jgi:hypothetical protein
MIARTSHSLRCKYVGFNRFWNSAIIGKSAQSWVSPRNEWEVVGKPMTGGLLGGFGGREELDAMAGRGFERRLVRGCRA